MSNSPSGESTSSRSSSASRSASHLNPRRSSTASFAPQTQIAIGSPPQAAMIAAADSGSSSNRSLPTISASSSHASGWVSGRNGSAVAPCRMSSSSCHALVTTTTLPGPDGIAANACAGSSTSSSSISRRRSALSCANRRWRSPNDAGIATSARPNSRRKSRNTSPTFTPPGCRRREKSAHSTPPEKLRWLRCAHSPLNVDLPTPRSPLTTATTGAPAVSLRRRSSSRTASSRVRLTKR